MNDSARLDPLEPAKRPDDDDYDLLTYGEAAARLDEVLRSDRRELLRLTADPSATAEQIAQQRERVRLLEERDDGFRRHAETADRFMATFGLTARPRR